MRYKILLNLLLLGLTCTQAHAYIGPGAGAGAISVVVGLIGSIFLAVLGILWYPFKRIFKSKKSPPKNNR